ncbi:TorD/DmsD family molecular chaperone [Halapricum hydrolyticum]|uniref:Molecular chaperone TorD family protein n=1 Tax=Halapricum hydrolyticum TaxID=2979991 RepID=A0AAE3LF66_9EURY|nr:molecular chaperone TorD family protein [Halapricum hydrolyticum]MCU4718276.1 molecular chaperone TorD family protein [Halapricum hydrolyticum]MCU4727276.1 molecular chaperone TorD family protein [Halapricum hydrolyticum]
MNQDTHGTAELAQLYSLLSECLKHPDEAFYEDVAAGRFDAEREQLTSALGLDADAAPSAEHLPDSRAALDNQYISLFEAFETPYAPPIESPYKEWHEGAGSDGLLGGPPADDMRRKYAALDASPPVAYQPDHLALLLEYASLLVESADRDVYATFVDEHLDWLPAFRHRVEDAAADAPFYRRSVALVCDAVAAERDRLGVTEPDSATIATMLERVEQGTAGIDEEKEFRG